ncbi:hypothetical protein [Gorillibacterium sp. sgz5001074]|uniref:hypothetical protein n=1 Tax=Gorillibacterium sp. sgz5001074 TaxID=3446695 RepID=UPI003F67354B
MFKKGDVLKSPADFDNAMLFGILVEVWQRGELLDYGSRITKHTESAVFLDDAEGYFLKATCQFKVR